MDTETVSPNFDDIRPLNNSEVKDAIEKLVANEDFERALRYIKPNLNWEEFSVAMRACKTKEEFKSTLAYDAVMTVAKNTTFSLTISGRSRLPKDKAACTFISNHRDIVLDASFLNVMLYDVGYGMTQVAIGDNLLIRPWIKTLVRLNNSFIVKRGVSVRQMLEVSKTLSAYIHHAIKNVNESVWIAQREGRAKDSDDRNVINISFAEPEKAGSTDGKMKFDISGLTSDYTKDDFKKDVKSIQAQGKKIVLSIGGYEGYFSLTSDNAVNQFVSDIKSIINEYGFDGIDIDLEQSTTQIEIFDTGIAILAGLMIIPAVFAFSGGNPEMLNAGPSLMFITLPKVFASMGIGTGAGILFFVLVLLAALTSAVSLMETSVSTFMDELHWSRGKASLLMAVVMIVFGSASSLGYGVLDFIRIFGMNFLDFFDFMTNSVMMPLAALATCFLVTKVVGFDRIAKEIEQSSKFGRKKLYNFFLKYLAPICLIVILLSSIANVLGIISM